MHFSFVVWQLFCFFMTCNSGHCERHAKTFSLCLLSSPFQGFDAFKIIMLVLPCSVLFFIFSDFTFGMLML